MKRWQKNGGRKMETFNRDTGERHSLNEDRNLADRNIFLSAIFLSLFLAYFSAPIFLPLPGVI